MLTVIIPFFELTGERLSRVVYCKNKKFSPIKKVYNQIVQRLK